MASSASIRNVLRILRKRKEELEDRLRKLKNLISDLAPEVEEMKYNLEPNAKALNAIYRKYIEKGGDLSYGTMITYFEDTSEEKKEGLKKTAEDLLEKNDKLASELERAEKLQVITEDMLETVKEEIARAEIELAAAIAREAAAAASRVFRSIIR
ncbi:MAG: hypothetical protein QM697_09935 [Lachnospiraceae bacterium]